MNRFAMMLLFWVFYFNQIACTTIVAVHKNIEQAVKVDKNNWSNVLRLLPGDHLIVELKDGSEIEGFLNMVTEEYIIIYFATGETRVERWNVLNIKLITEEKRQGVLELAAIGAYQGAITMAVSILAFDLLGGIRGVSLKKAMLVAAAFGAAVGALYNGLINGIILKNKLKNVAIIYEAE